MPLPSLCLRWLQVISCTHLSLFIYLCYMYLLSVFSNSRLQPVFIMCRDCKSSAAALFINLLPASHQQLPHASVFIICWLPIIIALICTCLHTLAAYQSSATFPYLYLYYVLTASHQMHSSAPSSSSYTCCLSVISNPCHACLYVLTASHQLHSCLPFFTYLLPASHQPSHTSVSICADCKSSTALIRTSLHTIAAYQSSATFPCLWICLSVIFLMLLKQWRSEWHDQTILIKLIP